MATTRPNWMTAIAEGRMPRTKHLAMLLSNLPSADEPRLDLEQYTTPGDLAATWLIEVMNNCEHDWVGREVFDLGAGNGVLGLGCALLGASRVVLIDSDQAALDAAMAATAQLRELVGMRADVEFLCETLEGYWPNRIKMREGAVIVMNPPWGTQLKKADRVLLEAAFRSSAEHIHLLHSSSAKHPMAMAKDSGWESKVVLQADFQLPATYGHHRRDQMLTRIACWAFSRPADAEV